jgi:hypothetical protein
MILTLGSSCNESLRLISLKGHYGEGRVTIEHRSDGKACLLYRLCWKVIDNLGEYSIPSDRPSPHLFARTTSGLPVIWKATRRSHQAYLSQENVRRSKSNAIFRN